MNESSMIMSNKATRLEMLRMRTKRCCCKYCGAPLKLKQISFSDFNDGRVEIFCEQCNRIEFGVETELYKSAKNFVENSKFNCYLDIEDENLSKQMTVAKVCEIMAWEARSLGILADEGFTIPIQMQINEGTSGNCLTLTEDELQTIQENRDK